MGLIQTCFFEKLMFRGWVLRSSNLRLEIIITLDTYQAMLRFSNESIIRNGNIEIFFNRHYNHGKPQQVLFLFTGDIRKTPCSFFIASNTWSYEWTIVKSHYEWWSDPPLSNKVPIVKFDTADLMIRWDKGQIKDSHVIITFAKILRWIFFYFLGFMFSVFSLEIFRWCRKKGSSHGRLKVRIRKGFQTSYLCCEGDFWPTLFW